MFLKICQRSKLLRMLIASRQKLSNISERPSLTINDIAVEQVASAKSLGVYIDQTLNWECHIENISKKIASAIGAIKRIRPSSDAELFMSRT